MADSQALLSRLERLEAENRALRDRVDALDSGLAAADSAVQAPIDGLSRRSLLRRVGTGAAAIGLGSIGASVVALGAPGAVRANGEPVTVGGTYTDAVTTTTIRNHVNDSDVLFASSSGAGLAIHGYSANASGVFGDTLAGAGVLGISHGDGVGYGVRGESDANIAVSGGAGTTGIGVQGTSASGSGVEGGSTSGDGVVGFSDGGAGVRAHSHAASTAALVAGSDLGRGAILSGALAQARLTPSSAASHPKTGARGDLFVDKSGRLWFCKGGQSWKQLA